MSIAFAHYLVVLPLFSTTLGLWGVWLAVLVCMGLMGVTQAAWYPRMVQQLRLRTAQRRSG